MAPEGSSDGSSDCVSLEGMNIGASMSIHHSFTGERSQDGCYCINMYINNNVQGVNNSILLGSKVTMRNPGVHVHFHNSKLDKVRIDTTTEDEEDEKPRSSSFITKEYKDIPLSLEDEELQSSGSVSEKDEEKPESPGSELSVASRFSVVMLAFFFLLFLWLL